MKRLSKFYGFIIVTLLPFIGYSQITQTFTTSGTWVCPANVSTVKIECWGAGGGGGGTNASLSSGGGGAGGSYSSSTIVVATGVSYQYVVGTGGTGTVGNGGAGGATWFSSNSTVFAQGGGGGNAGTAGTLGIGGVASLVGNIGSTTFTGGSGAVGVLGSYGGSGGGGAGSAGNGGAPALIAGLPFGGAGGSGGGGAGGASSNILAGGDGVNGTAPGGGGSGGNNLVVVLGTPPTRTGGNGGNGQIIITYTPSVPTPIVIEYFNCTGGGNGNSISYKVNVSEEMELDLILERSNDGKSFSAIQKQKVGADICKEPFVYVDKEFNINSTFYRLKAVNMAGETNISKVVEVKNAPLNQKHISFGPNPVTNSLKLNIQATSADNIGIIITDLSGKKIIQKNTRIAEGTNSFEMNLSELYAGNYIITVTGDNGNPQTFRFIKD